MERLKRITYPIMVFIIVYLLADHLYSRGYDDGYYDALDEENAYACELFDA